MSQQHSNLLNVLQATTNKKADQRKGLVELSSDSEKETLKPWQFQRRAGRDLDEEREHYR